MSSKLDGGPFTWTLIFFICFVLPVGNVQVSFQKFCSVADALGSIVVIYRCSFFVALQTGENPSDVVDDISLLTDGRRSVHGWCRGEHCRARENQTGIKLGSRLELGLNCML